MDEPHLPTQAPSAHLTAILHERIAHAGAIPFADFMEMALYHPEYGYYTAGREKVGWEGDYVTSVDLHFLFGACIGRQLAQMWELLGRPARFTVREYGAGRGLLARDVWRYARERAPDFARALRYTLVDKAPPASTDDDAPIIWAEADAVASEEPVVGCVLSNELIDAFPVHIVEVRGGRFYEVYVTERQGRLVETLGDITNPDLLSYLATYSAAAAHFSDGWRAEVNRRAPTWLAAVAGQLRRGFVLTIDYGDRAPALYTRGRPRGTLAAYYRHSLSDQPLARPGEQDLTAHVNFSALIDAGRRAGLRLAGLTTQRDFLLALGIRDEVEALIAMQYGAALRERASDQGQAALLRAYSLRNAIGALIDPAGLGGFRVLIQHRGVPGAGRRLLGLRRLSP
jgi:SAM-dependent MidA family methyltransferase